MKNETADLIADLHSRINRIVEAAQHEGKDQALAQLRGLLGGAAPVRRGPGRPKGSKNAVKPVAKKGKKRKNSWSGLTAEQKLARVNAIRKGRGLPPKSA
jgi:hypothetical protein